VRILILQLKRIGDLILTTPIVHALREHLPQAELTLVTDASCRTLAAAIPVDHCWYVQRGAVAQGLLGFGPNAWIRRHLILGRYDFCLDLTGTDRSLILSLLSGSKRRVTYARFRKKFLRSAAYTDFVDSSVRDRHTADHHTDLLQPLEIATESVPLDIRIDETTAKRARELLIKTGISQNFAIIHAGTARPEKYWLPERWAAVAQHLQGTHRLRLVLTGSPDAAEQAHLAAIRAAAPSVDFADLSGRTTLIELAAIIREASIFCGVDTAAMHLADAMRTPTVALFGPTNPYHWRPRHTRAIILRAKTEEPFTPAQKGGSLREIKTDVVCAAANEVLNT
jgi:predicted lipopolysaccharide heptosyltransferase III